MSRWDALGERYAGLPYEAKVIKERLTRDVEAALRSSHREGADLEDDVRGGGPEYFRAALQESRREGAEAAAKVCEEMGAFGCAAKIRALPIPGKTDAG